MKTFNQFMTEAYSAQDELNEVVGAVARGASRFIPGLQTAYGLYRGTSALMKGDKTGAALGYGSALPGPLGWGFAAADMGRELARGDEQPQAQKPTKTEPTKTEPTKTDTAPTAPANNAAASKSAVLSKKDGVEGTGVGKDFVAKKWSDAERQRYQSKRGSDQLKKDAINAARSAASKGYAGQQPKSLDLKKPVKIDKTNFANVKPRYNLPKISA
jgi:hypothetical protein